MARNPTAPGANGRRKRAVASLWVRAGDGGPSSARLSVVICASWEGGEWSGGERTRARVEPRLGEEAGGAAGGAPAAHVAAGEHEVVLGAGGGDVEQPSFLLEVLGVGALQRAPGREQLLLAAEQEDELGFGSLGPVDGRDGDAAVFAGSDLLGVQAGGVFEKAGDRGGGADLIGVGLRGAAERAQVLEHALAVAALLGARRAVAARLVLGDDAAVERERG